MPCMHRAFSLCAAAAAEPPSFFHSAITQMKTGTIKGFFTRVSLATVTEAQVAQVERSRAQATCGIIKPLKLQLVHQV